MVATGSPVATLFSSGWSRGVLILLWLTVFVPLVLVPDFFFPYVTSRSLYFRAVTELALAGVFFGLISRRWRLNRPGDSVFVTLLVFVAISGLSAALSPAPFRSFYGNFERMGGVWAWLHLALYYVLLRTVLDEAGWRIFFRVAVAVSVIVSLIGLGQAGRFIAASPSGAISAVSSTIGNSGLLAGYLLFGLAFAALLALRRDRLFPLYVVAGGLNLAIIALSQNRSAIIGIVLGVICGVSCYVSTSRTAFRRRAAYFALGVVLLVVAASSIERWAPQGRIARALPPVFERVSRTGNQGADELRLIQWRAALEGFRDHPVLGIGPENHTLLWTRHFNSRALRSDNGSNYDRPHNAYLEVLSTTGFFGFAAFVGIWIALFLTIRKAWRSGNLSSAELSLLLGLQIAYAVYLFFWFTDVNSTPLWIATAAYLGTRKSGTLLLAPRETGKPSRIVVAGHGLGIAAVCASLYLHVVEPLRVAHALDVVQRRDIPLQVGLSALDDIFDSRGPQKSFAVLVAGGYLGSLAPRFPSLRASRSDSALLDKVLSKAVVGSAREVDRDSLNDRLRIEYAKLLLVAGQFYANPVYTRAGVWQIQRAVELSPNRVSSQITLAKVFARVGELPRALAVARTASIIDPTLGEPHYELARVNILAGDFDSAAVHLRTSLDLGFVRASDEYLTAGGELEKKGNLSGAVSLYVAYLERRFGRRIWSGETIVAVRPEKADVRLAAHLPLVYLMMDDLANARRSARALSSLDGRLKPVVTGFESALGVDRGERWRGKLSLLGCLPRADAAREAHSVEQCENFLPGAGSLARARP